MKIWYDITNTPQVHFILALRDSLGKKMQHQSLVSTREFSETTGLLRQKTNENFHVIGAHKGKKTAKKIGGLISRLFQVYRSISDYDVSISCGSEAAVWSATLKHKMRITFGDNDLARQWTYGLLVDMAFFPDSIDKAILTRQGISKKRMIRYHGYKEDIYLADFHPDKDFTATLPFSNYVVVRPENLQANYLNNNSAMPITPILLNKLSQEGYNILFLPRYKTDRAYAEGIKSIYIPEQPLNGLDACYYADAVLTGAGTFAREAACLGVPSFSFFAGKSLLAVDRALIKDGRMFFSRDVKELMSNLRKSDRREVELSRSKAVQDEVISKLIEVLES